MDAARFNNQISKLIISHLQNDLTPDEQVVLEGWRNESAANDLLFLELTSEDLLKAEMKELAGLSDDILALVYTKVPDANQVTSLYKHASFKWVAAASIMVLVFAIYHFINPSPTNKGEGKDISYAASGIAAPDRSKAMIVLANGEEVLLDNSGRRTLLKLGNINVIKNEAGEIVYQSDQSNNKGAATTNTLINPRGSPVVSLMLSDGTKVWLNAGSSLQYPTVFIGTERSVSIEGEAYFEVARYAAMPFMVQSGSTAIRVLGTHFNVNAFPEEGALKVTLLEGRVAVSKGTVEKYLKPGEQARVGKEMQVFHTINLEEVMAWKNGKFYFNKTDIQATMRQLARWYDVEIEYSGNVHGYFSGSISRKEQVSEVLDMLALTNEARFSIEGRKIIVKP